MKSVDTWPAPRWITFTTFKRLLTRQDRPDDNGKIYARWRTTTADHLSVPNGWNYIAALTTCCTVHSHALPMQISIHLRPLMSNQDARAYKINMNGSTLFYSVLSPVVTWDANNNENVKRCNARYLVVSWKTARIDSGTVHDECRTLLASFVRCPTRHDRQSDWMPRLLNDIHFSLSLSLARLQTVVVYTRRFQSHDFPWLSTDFLMSLCRYFLCFY